MELNQFQFVNAHQTFICTFDDQQLNLIIFNKKQLQFYFQKTITKENYIRQSNQIYKLLKQPHDLFQQLKKAFYFNLLEIQYNQICIKSQSVKKQETKCLPLSKIKTTTLERHFISKMSHFFKDKQHNHQIKQQISQTVLVSQQTKGSFQEQKEKENQGNRDIQLQILMTDKNKQRLSKTYNLQISTKLFIGNLAFNSTNQSCYQFFSQAGKVKQVKIIKDRLTGKVIICLLNTNFSNRDQIIKILNFKQNTLEHFNNFNNSKIQAFKLYLFRNFNFPTRKFFQLFSILTFQYVNYFLILNFNLKYIDLSHLSELTELSKIFLYILRQSKGFGYVQYFDIQTAKRAYALLNGKTLNQRKIRIDLADQKNN